MHDHPEPTEEEHEQGPDRRNDEEAMRGAGHEDRKQDEPEEDPE